MNTLGIVCVLLALVFFAFSLRSWSRAKDGKLLRAGLYAMPATIALLSTFLLLLVISNLMNYQRLTHERDIARLSIQKSGEQKFLVSLTFPDGQDGLPHGRYQLAGDEWRLEAKILKWTGWANLIGMDSYYQLDRISGRYRDIELANSQPASAYHLSQPPRGIDLWELKNIMKSKMPFLDTYFGQAVFMPLAAGAEFTVSINQSGLIARPANDVARKALEGW